MTRWLMTIALLILFSETALALRCNKRIIVHGDHKSRVYKLCGEPEYIEHKTEYIDTGTGSRSRFNDYQSGNQTIFEQDTTHLIPIHFEVWTYNFGPRRLVQHLQFRDGKLFNIQVDGYGY